MLPRARASIINVASMSGSIVNRGLTQAHYNSSKAAVIHLSKSLAMEWADRGLRVNVHQPGLYADADEQAARGRRAGQDLRARHADGPHGTPEEMVGPAVFLAQPRCRASSPAST